MSDYDTDGSPHNNKIINSIVRENLMERAGYSPYCGNERCYEWPRTAWSPDLSQFKCETCGWVSEFPDDFIKLYKEKWHNE